MTARAGRHDAPLRVLIAGGGVAALEAALALRHLAEERVALELLSPEPHFWYRPLSVLEPFDAGTVHGVELGELAAACGAAVTLSALDSVDVDAHLARTHAGQEIEYDALLVAVGARPTEAVDGALTFRGPADTQRLRSLLVDIAGGAIRRLVFAVPGGVNWPLPLYELALQTAACIGENELARPELSIVTPEHGPLEIFGGEPSTAVSELLSAAGVAFRGDSYPISFDGRTLTLRPEGSVPADGVVALPRLVGPKISGLPHNKEGFIPVDRHGRVRGVDDVFVAGDAADFPIKQGGLAAQQADAAAESIAAVAGVDLIPQPFDPILRGLLLTGDAPQFFRTELPGGHGATSTAHTEALWWPPAKIVGRYLAPVLADRAGLVLTPPTAASLPVDLHLGATTSADDAAASSTSERTPSTTRRPRRMPTTPGPRTASSSLSSQHAFDIEAVKERLAERGGYEVVHSSAGLEIGVYALIAPEPDRQQPHEDDEVYIVLGGRGTLEIEGAAVELSQGQAVFVRAGAAHRFIGYEQLIVLVIFERRP